MGFQLLITYTQMYHSASSFDMVFSISRTYMEIELSYWIEINLFPCQCESAVTFSSNMTKPVYTLQLDLRGMNQTLNWCIKSDKSSDMHVSPLNCILICYQLRLPLDYKSLVVRKPVFGVSDQVRHKHTPFTQLLQTRVCFTNAGINNNKI